MGGEAYRCPNHPDKLACGRCNDCGENFCDECLTAYTLNTQNERAVLYLCPNCLRKRRAEKANAMIVGGIFLILLGVFSGLVAWPVGILIGLIGVALLAYGVSQGTETTQGPTTAEQKAEEEKGAVGVEEDLQAEQSYNRLLTYYVDHWGARTGIELLDNEIKAYTSRGQSFAYAVRKICERQEKNLRNV
jgi:hypothetical protein